MHCSLKWFLMETQIFKVSYIWPCGFSMCQTKALEEPEQHATFYTFRSRRRCLLTGKANKVYESGVWDTEAGVFIHVSGGTMLQSLVEQSSDFRACYILITFTRKLCLLRHLCLLQADPFRVRSSPHYMIVRGNSFSLRGLDGSIWILWNIKEVGWWL